MVCCPLMGEIAINKRAEDFSMPDADNMIELNGIKSELVISMEEM